MRGNKKVKEMNLEQSAKEVAAKANECCNRSDGWEKEIEALILQKLKEAYNENKETKEMTNFSAETENYKMKASLSVGKCNCEIGMCTHRADCRNNPLNIAQAEMDNASTKFDSSNANLSVEVMLLFSYKQIWNYAIEAAAEVTDGNTAGNIRRLKI